MRFKRLTDADDWNWRTFVDCARRPSWWHFGMCEWTWFEWRYDWYDGPIWQLRTGPFYACLGFPS